MEPRSSFFRLIRRKTLRVSIALLLLTGLAGGLLSTATMSGASPDTEVSIVFTHDMHSHFDPERYVTNGQVQERGGFARMASAISAIQSDYPGSYLLDAGDFSMGTLYQTVFSTDAAELRMLGLLGYDATTLGNHEYDYRTQGLTDMLYAALASNDQLPRITLANIDWEKTLADERKAEKGAALKQAMDQYGVADYVMIEKDGVKLAAFGINGKESDSYAPESGLYFKDQIETAKAIVARIKTEQNPDIIVCLSHSGTFDDPKKSEDELLAKAVPDIDVIISGHTHTRLEQPIVIGSTLVVSCGEHTYNIGHLLLAHDGTRYRVSHYELVPIHQNLAKQPDIEAAIVGFRDLVNQHYLSQFGYQYDQVLANAPFGFTPIDDFGKVQGEETLGNLIADSYIAAVQKAEGDQYQPVDVAIVPHGVIRASLTEGNITVAEAFSVSSLGIGADKIPGYPLVSIYLTGKELKTTAEIDISVSTLMSQARLYMSGLSYNYNTNRLILNRVTGVSLMGSDGALSVIDDNKLYRVIGGLYSCQMLGEVESRSFGLLKIVPKDSSGDPIIDFEDHLVTSNGGELKEWVALADYLASFEPVDGTAQIPQYYNQPQGRKVDQTNWSILDLLKSPNKIFFIVIGVVVVVMAIIITPTWLIIRKVRRSRKHPAKKAKTSD